MAKTIDSDSEGEVVYDSSEERQELGMDEIVKNNYIKLPADKEKEIKIQKIEKVEDSEYHFSNTDYKVEITDEDGQILSITAHKLWGMIKAAIREAVEKHELDTPKGMRLRLQHPGRGKYKVSWYDPDLDGFVEIEDKNKE